MDASVETDPQDMDSGDETVERVGKLETLSPAIVIERLMRGKLIENVRVARLRFKGEFPLPVHFRNVMLIKPQIDGASFGDAVVFEHCSLDNLRINKTNQFAKGLSFAGSTLNKPILRGMTVEGILRLDNVILRGRFYADKNHFQGPVHFWDAKIRGWIEFKNCTFDDSTDFRSIHCDEGFIIDKCTFHEEVLFRGATVCKKLQADGSRFEGLLDLSKAKLHDFVYLETIEQGPEMRFAFSNAVAERVLIRPDQIEGRLQSEQANEHGKAMQEYGFLKRIFEGLHRYEQEDWAFYRYKVNQRLSKPRTWRRPLSKITQFCDWLLLDIGCGYGTNPVRAVRMALLIVLGFAAIYAAGIDLMDVEKTPFNGPASSMANRIMIASLTSVSAFTSGFGDIKGAAHGWMNLPLIAESLLGTLLWGLFIVAFSRKVIR